MAIYQGTSSNIRNYLSSTDYFYIPEYQRSYSWTAMNIKELVHDIKDGLRKFKIMEEDDRNENYSKYLGCVIDWSRDRDTKDILAEHHVTNEYIHSVRELIDGQQRTSTLAILISRLFLKLEGSLHLLDIQGSSEEVKLAESVLSYQDKYLLSCFSRYDVATSTRRPFIIRQGDDKWSLDLIDSYTSPLSSYLANFISTFGVRPSCQLHDLEFDITVNDSHLKSAIEACDENIDIVIEEISELKILDERFTGEELFENLYTGFGQVDLSDYLIDKPDRKGVIVKVVALCAYIKYLLDYSYLTIISSPSQNKSLEIFQSINSTGVQLSAFDLVKPLISKSFTDDGQSFNESEAFIVFNEVDKWLAKGNKWYKSTTRIKEYFEIAKYVFNVDAQASNLSGQRKIITEGLHKYLDSRPSDMSKSQSAFEFCKLLKTIMLYTNDFILNKNFFNLEEFQSPDGAKYLNSSRYHEFDDETGACFLFLLSSHPVCNAFLISIYHKYLNSERESNGEYIRLLFNAIRFCAVFFSYYRLIANKYPDAFWKDVYSSQEMYKVTVDEDYVRTIKSDFENNLISMIGGGDGLFDDIDFIKEKVSRNAKYGSSGSLIKFFILAANHKTLLFADSSGLETSSSMGHSILTTKNYLSPDLSSIEHIAPHELINTSLEPWDERLCEASDVVNSIGNLTLISQPLNSSIKTNAFSKAEAFSKLLDSNFDRELTNITEHCSGLIESSDRQHHLKAVSHRLCLWLLDSDSPNENYSWDRDFIVTRTSNMIDNFIDNTRALLQ
ncbi:conserved hypothetical protein [Vibrio chagasii]|nr:Putative Dnd SspBCDE component [Vibrio chagasii]CAH6893829.1 conserved hypothetical protein [Vibrio chagasii]CAH6968505.1 conserved hypothetical protein [Vibrio chagasii]CAH7122268.1 conserved hypothetical protein [Vibrio chagasii]CAH7152733.1 conserved hypothetical protein [Vibrio chagasii]